MPYFWVEDETQIIIDALKNRISELEAEVAAYELIQKMKPLPKDACGGCDKRDQRIAELEEQRDRLAELLNQWMNCNPDEWIGMRRSVADALASLDQTDSEVADKQNPTGEG